MIVPRRGSPGRPPKADADKEVNSVRVYLTDAQLETLNAERGSRSASAFFRDLLRQFVERG